MELLREIDEPERLRSLARTRSSPPTGEDSRRGRPHNWMHCVLPSALKTGEQVEVPVLVGEDLTRPPRPRRIVLRVEMIELIEADSLEFAVNGHVLVEQHREGIAITCPVELDYLIAGRNKVEISATSGAVEANKMWIKVSY
jgi:hypothetical protein